ncbi:MAG: septum formation initiator family protein [Ardenticatenia bacterium]|nr:septum formation initiator family protein [Ardenticatenia bacterium]
MNQSVLRVRGTKVLPPTQIMTGPTAQRALILLFLIGLILFLYLAEVSQMNTTAFDIQALERRYRQLQEANRELERQIAELESPTRVLEFARQNGFTPAYEADEVIIQLTSDGAPGGATTNE